MSIIFYKVQLNCVPNYCSICMVLPGYSNLSLLLSRSLTFQLTSYMWLCNGGTHDVWRLSMTGGGHIFTSFSIFMAFERRGQRNSYTCTRHSLSGFTRPVLGQTVTFTFYLKNQIKLRSLMRTYKTSRKESPLGDDRCQWTTSNLSGLLLYKLVERCLDWGCWACEILCNVQFMDSIRSVYSL